MKKLLLVVLIGSFAMTHFARGDDSRRLSRIAPDYSLRSLAKEHKLPREATQDRGPAKSIQIGPVLVNRTDRTQAMGGKPYYSNDLVNPSAN